MKAFILFYRLGSKVISDESLHALLHELPEAKRQSLSRITHSETRHHSLVGMYLLQQAMQLAGNKHFSLQQVHYPQQGKPFINGNFDFNISHSHDYVVCAVAENSRLGIDIEQRRDIDASRFARYFSRSLLENMQVRPGLFFDYWTQKEAVAKATGTGIRALSTIKLDGNRASYQGQTWYLSEIPVAENYACSLASSEQGIELAVKECGC